jgi:hypothetical protein
MPAIPGLSRAQAARSFAKLGEVEAWSVVSSRPVKLGDIATLTTSQSQTSRVGEVAPFDLVAVRLVYANWMNAFGSAEHPNYNAYRVRAAIHKAGLSAPARGVSDPVVPVLFARREFGLAAAGQLLVSDPTPVSIKAGERWFHETYADTYTGTAPAAPTLALAAGTGLAIANYSFAITFVYPDGSETPPSPEATIATTSGQQAVVVTPPAAVAGFIGWRMYVGGAGASGGIKYEFPTNPMAPFGVSQTLSTSYTPSALFRSVRTTAQIGLPLGRGTLAAAGENTVSGRDYVTTPVVWAGQDSYSGVLTPIFVLGVAADGRVHPSVAIGGDSIAAGTGDDGFGAALGGPTFRACSGQTGQIPFDATKTPKVGFMTLAQGGETVASFATPAGGSRRRAAAEFATTWVDNYGTNDTGAGAAAILANILSYFADIAGRKKYFRLTIDPKTSSTDGFKTVANQTIASTDAEADRRQINNVIKSTTGAVAVTDEALFRSAGTAVPADNLYSGGNGAATKFFPNHPFRTGTEVVKVAGVTKALTTDYTYRGTATIDGVTYASGITFLSAPANAAAVTMTYTKVAGFGSRAGFTGFFDTATEVEVNGAGVKTANGGFWAPAKAGVGVAGTATANAATVLTDSSKAWVVDQWRGMAVRITADATTPASVGQSNGIRTNTATALNLSSSWTVTPSATASYEIYQQYVLDGVHGSSTAQREKSLIIDTTKF